MIDEKEKLLNARLKEVKKLKNLAEVMRGSVFTRYIKCGNKNCHCSKDKGHKIYYFGITHGVGKTEQIVLPTELLKGTERQVKTYNKVLEALNEISRINIKLLRLKKEEIKKKKGEK